MKKFAPALFAIWFFFFANHACGQWIHLGSPFAHAPVFAIAVSGGNILALDGHLYLSTDNGTSWTAVDSGLPAVTSIAVSGNNIFAGTGGGVFLSINNGASWTAVNSGLTDSSIRSLAVNSSTIFAATNGGVFLSTNNGTSWKAVESGLPAIFGVNCFAVSGKSIFAGTGGGGVILSTDNGTSWKAVNSGLPAVPCVNCLAVSGSSIFAGVYEGISSGVYLSTNNGTSWKAVDSGLPAAPWVNCFAVSGSNIFTGIMSSFVYLSTNNGTSWTAVDSVVNSGLQMGDVLTLAASGNDIFAGTDNWGIWRRPLSEMVGVINPASHQGISKPYASGSKINVSKNGIAVSLPETLTNGAISVELFTVAGKRIYSAMHQACNGILNIPISGLSTGTYLMSIRANNTTLSSPFVVTK